MILTDFPGCCGAGVLSQLDNEYFLERQHAGAPELPPNNYNELLTSLKLRITQAKNNYRWGLLTATTNQKQTEVVKLLVKCGFELTGKFLNPKHNNSEVTLWSLDLAKVNLTELDRITLQDLTNDPG